MQVSTETTVLFRGIGGDPDEIREDSISLSFINKLNLQRIPLPEVRIQRTCPWNFPASAAQRREACDGGAAGKFSRFARCGYSAELAEGRGNLDAEGNPFTACDKSRAHCEQRGMFDEDQRQRATRRFGGFEFVPSTVNVRTAGDKAAHLSPVLSNTAKYNDAVPIVYGTAWLKAPIVFARNDGNLTHLEVLLGMGPITNVLKVVVNDVEIPIAVPGQDMNVTGWYTVFSDGNAQGSFNYDFADEFGKPLGDPYGSIAAMSVVVPNQISTGTSLPTVEVLIQGIEVDTFAATQDFIGTEFSNSPAWITLDILRRCGWCLEELDLSSFARSAAFCSELIPTADANGKVTNVQRFQCNLVIAKRQSAASIVRGIRVASSLMLRYGAAGLLELLPETTLAAQQSSPPDGTNSIEPLGGGWPAHEFSDDSAPFSGIVRGDSGASTVRIVSRSIAETSNRLSVEFQDEENEFQQDSLSLVDSSDSALIGYEVVSQSTALGVANYNQATRVLRRQLDKTLKGNLFVEFQTSFRALKVRPGDIITFTYLKEGFQRMPFRVVKLSPSMNYHFVRVTAQIHNDGWYSDDIDIFNGGGRQPTSLVQSPRPLIGLEPTSSSNAGNFDFGISEEVQILTDGTATDLLTVAFAQPAKPSKSSPRVPLVSLSPVIVSGGGTLAGQSTYYYAISAMDAQDQEGPLSFTIRASIDGPSDSNAVILKNLSFPANAPSFNVYRGTSPQLLYRIATNCPVATSFVDAGEAAQPLGPPDANFDHANFYYRFEVAGPLNVTATSASRKSLKCNDLGATPAAYTGMLVRIIEGSGAGQERSITNNSAGEITVASDWTTSPDETSVFVVCESSWRFAGVSVVGPVQFSIPYRAKTVLQITGRGANVHNQEGSPDLCPLTRFALGQSKPDFGVPAAPSFNLEVPGSGRIALSEVGFASDDNIASITSGTLNLYYWNELSASSKTLLASLDTTTSTISLAAPLEAAIPRFVLAGTEILYVLSEIEGQANSYNVVRGQLGSAALEQAAGQTVIELQNGKLVVPFESRFFQNRASVNLIHSFNMPDIRIGAAEFFVSNGFGSSQAAVKCFTGYESIGLRTLSGGQFSLQMSGFTVTQQNATPPLFIEASHAIRDVRATLGEPAIGYDTKIDIFQTDTSDNRSFLCSLVVPAGQTSSNIADGGQIAFLREKSVVTSNVSLIANGQPDVTPRPGKDLTATIRL